MQVINFFRRCLGCGFALFCGKDCQTLGWKDHKAECKGLRTAKTIPDIETRLLGRIVLRHKEICIGKDKKTEGFYEERTSQRSVLEIWAHTDMIRQDNYAMNKFEEIYKQLTQFYEQKFMLPKDIVFELHCRDFINRHAISDKSYVKEIGKGLYCDLCAYDHSCRPNAIFTCNGFVATLRGLNRSVDIRNRSTTFYTYIDLLSSMQQRKKLLKDTWYFDCQCERCTDSSDHLLTSILCPNCPSNGRGEVCIFDEQSYKHIIAGVITCEKCGNEVQKDHVMEAVNIMRYIDKIIEDKEIEQMPKKTRIEFLEDLLKRYSNILSETNIYLCRLIQKLIPLVSSNNNEELLQLHLRSESCVRRCFPHNHPAVAFHLRNIGIFMNNLSRYQEAISYFREADEIMEFSLDSDHPMTVENRLLLKQTLKNYAVMESESSESTQSAKSDVVSGTSSLRDEIVENTAKKVKSLTVESQPDVGKKSERSIQSKKASPEKSHKGKFSDLYSDDLSDLPELIQ